MSEQQPVTNIKAPAAPSTNTTPKLKYPAKDPKQWGPHYWYYLQNTVADNFPEQPSRTDRMEWGRWLKFNIKTLPCKQECVPHAVEFMRTRPPDLSSKKNFFKWLVDFHNNVNEITGKEERVKSDEIFDTSGNTIDCPNCVRDDNTTTTDSKSDISNNINNKPDSSDDNNTTHEPTVKDKVTQIQEIVKQTLIEQAQARGLPPPEIVFEPCADGSDTSCIINGKKIYIHPKRLRELFHTMFHEFDHYEKFAKGTEIDDSDNPNADKFADEQLAQIFAETEKQPPQQGQQGQEQPIKVVHEKKKRRQIVQPIQMVMPADPYKQVVREVYSAPAAAQSAIPTTQAPQMFGEMPQFQQALASVQANEMVEEAVEHKRNTKDGVLSHLDPIYSWPADLMGVKPYNLNLIHTPRLIAGIALILMDSYLTPPASGSISLLLGIILMLLPVVLKERLVVRDLELLIAIGANLFWDTTKYLSPKRMYDLKKYFDRLQKHSKDGELDWRKLIETPGDHVKEIEMLEYQAKSQIIVPPPMTPDEIRRHHMMEGARVSNYKRFPDDLRHVHSRAMDAEVGMPMGSSNMLPTERPLSGGGGYRRDNSNVIQLAPFGESDLYRYG